MQANPIVVKELRGRMRGWRAAIVLSLYLLVLSGVMLLFYAIARPTSQNGALESSQVGKLLFAVIVTFQTFMVALLTPAFTAAAITGEREQKTFDLLMVTLLRPRSVVLGKLGSALAYVALLIVAVAPLQSLAFMFGGVSPEEIILSQVVMLAAAILFASIGIFWSTALRSSVMSNVFTYGIILLQMLIIPFFYLFQTMGLFYAYMLSSSGQPDATGIYVNGAILSFNPLVAMGLSEALLSQGKSLFIDTIDLPGGTASTPLLIVSPWLVFCVEALLLSLVLVLISIRLVQPVHYRSHPKTVESNVAPVEVSGTVLSSPDQPTTTAEVPSGPGEAQAS
jgi:ABC-2 type transport system permease protein